MIGIEVLIPGGLVVPTPEGDVYFPPGEWVKFKPKWSQWPLEQIASNAFAMKIQIKDEDEDIFDLGNMDKKEAEAFVRRYIAYMARFIA